jgi:MFS family permease
MARVDRRVPAAPRAPDLAQALPATGTAAGVARPNTRVLGLLALGHLVVDMNQSSLAPLLPFLKGVFGLSYAASGAILLVSSLTSSLVQPIFGYLADRATRRLAAVWSSGSPSGRAASASRRSAGSWITGGFHAALRVVTVLPLAGLAFALCLPEPRS